MPHLHSRWRPAACMGALVSAVALVLALGGCSRTLSESKVRKFVDEADRAFIEGDSIKMCDVRAKDYVQTDTEFMLAEGHIVNSQAEAEAIEAERSANGQRLTGKDVKLGQRELCVLAYQGRRDFGKVEMTRTSIQIELSPDGKSAVVKAHYSMLVPLFAQRDSGVFDGARAQHVGTKQMETDDESVVVVEGGDILFKSTRSVSRSFQIPKKPNPRI
jgi:hypothetical protein